MPRNEINPATPFLQRMTYAITLLQQLGHPHADVYELNAAYQDEDAKLLTASARLEALITKLEKQCSI